MNSRVRSRFQGVVIHRPGGFGELLVLPLGERRNSRIGVLGGGWLARFGGLGFT
jgi:hypothetical protein